MTEGFTEHENLGQFSFPVIPSRYTAGVMGKKGEKKVVSEKQTECLPEQVLQFLKCPPNNRGEIHWVTCLPHTLQKKSTVLQIQKNCS
jgi:hypothetical protein